MVGRHHRLNGHEFEQATGDSEGYGSLVCHSPWDRKELGTTELLNNSSTNKRPQTAKEILRRRNKVAGITLFYFKLYCKSLLNEIVCSWH